MTIDPAVSQQDVGSPATRYEPEWRVVGHLAGAAAVEVAEHVDGGEQLFAVWVGAQAHRRQDARGELARGVVALAELLDVVVLQRALDLRGEVECELELLRGCALPDGLADLWIGNLGVQQDLEQLAEQHHGCVRAVGDVELELDQRPAGFGVLDADAVVEEVDDLVGYACRGLGAERQQRGIAGIAKHGVAPADRLAGCVTHVLREHPPPVRRDHLQIPVFGSERAEQLELLDRLADPCDRSRLLTELLDRCRYRTGADREQIVEAVLKSWRQE